MISDLDVFGAYVPPLPAMMLAAWAAVVLLRRGLDHFGLLRRVWHPALFIGATYVLVLCLIVRIVVQ